MPPSDYLDRHYLQMCLQIARLSPDPATKVGAVIVGPNGGVLVVGYNDLPRGQRSDLWHDREAKLRLVVHAEMNAILSAARLGISIDGATLYLAATDDSGEVWGGPPCTRCSVEVIQAGIREIVSWPFKSGPSRWAEDIAVARQILATAGVAYRELQR